MQTESRKPKTTLCVSVINSTAKKGDIRLDGSVFWSKRKVGSGYREWWVTADKFSQLVLRSRIVGKTHYHKSEKGRAKNRSAGAKAAKKAWKENNRYYFASFHAERRAAIRGTRKNLTTKEKMDVMDIYKFRDVLNSVHRLIMFEVDHIKPVSRGGAHTPENLRVTTKTFNRRKWANYTETIDTPVVIKRLK